MLYKIMKKWDGSHTEVLGGFASMADANDRINAMIASGDLPPTEGEHREYYIFPDVDHDSAPADIAMCNNGCGRQILIENGDDENTKRCTACCDTSPDWSPLCDDKGEAIYR